MGFRRGYFHVVTSQLITAQAIEYSEGPDNWVKRSDIKSSRRSGRLVAHLIRIEHWMPGCRPGKWRGDIDGKIVKFIAFVPYLSYRRAIIACVSFWCDALERIQDTFRSGENGAILLADFGTCLQ